MTSQEPKNYPYTNRKGHIYYLCLGRTKTGKPRYYFARQPQDEPVEAIPAGYRISESVNGVVSLVKDRPQLISQDELAEVEAAIRRHPKRANYRVGVKGAYILIYELLGPDADTLVDLFSHASPIFFGDVKKHAQEFLDRNARFTPVMRFRLMDRKTRMFAAERYNYRRNDWMHISGTGSADQLASKLIPMLGTDRFFDLY